jgi:hypothetical protein
VRDDTPLPDLLQSHLFYQPHKRIERSARLERAYALEVLAFEEQPE